LICTVPLLAAIRPPTILRKVVLPQPLGPSSVTSLPTARSNVTFSIATSGGWLARVKDWWTSLKWPNGVAAGFRSCVALSCAAGMGAILTA